MTLPFCNHLFLHWQLQFSISCFWVWPKLPDVLPELFSISFVPLQSGFYIVTMLTSSNTFFLLKLSEAYRNICQKTWINRNNGLSYLIHNEEFILTCIHLSGRCLFITLMNKNSKLAFASSTSWQSYTEDQSMFARSWQKAFRSNYP